MWEEPPHRLVEPFLDLVFGPVFFGLVSFFCLVQ